MHIAIMVALLAAAQDISTISPGGIEAIGPKQDDPRAMCSTDGPGVISPGGVEAIGPKQDDPRKLAIGPKQDDPLTPGVLARPGDDGIRRRAAVEACWRSVRSRTILGRRCGWACSPGPATTTIPRRCPSRAADEAQLSSRSGFSM